MPPNRRTQRSRSALLAARALPAVLCLAGPAAHAQTASESLLRSQILTRIEGDRSQACVQAARIDLRATPVVTLASACAGPRAAVPAQGARFEIGSISKAFVGILAAEMVARGELQLDEPLSALMPKALAAQQRVPVVTVADLLTHTAGLGPLPPGLRPASPANPYADLTPDVVYGGLGRLPLAPGPQSPYRYSNWAFLMLSDLLARRAGKPYDELLRERVLAPLGLRDTLVTRNDGLTPGRMSNGLPTPSWDVPVAYAGAGGVRSTVDDLARVARALLGEIPPGTSGSLVSALRSSRSKLRDAGEAVDVAWAWHLLKRKDRPSLVFHNGMTAGASAMLVLDIEQRRAAITLADAAGGLDDLALHILDSSSPLEPARRPVALDLPLAQRAAGRYQLAPQFIINVSVDGGRLYAQATGQERFELKQDSRGDHYAEVADIALRFTGTEAGRIDALTLRQGGGAFRASRID